MSGGFGAASFGSEILEHLAFNAVSVQHPGTVVEFTWAPDSRLLISLLFLRLRFNSLLNLGEGPQTFNPAPFFGVRYTTPVWLSGDCLSVSH